MATVTVHRWTKYDISTDELRVSRRMATLDAIEKYGGGVVDNTAREIDAADLDPAVDGMTPRDFYLRSNRTGFQTQVL